MLNGRAEAFSGVGLCGVVAGTHVLPRSQEVPVELRREQWTGTSPTSRAGGAELSWGRQDKYLF